MTHTVRSNFDAWLAYRRIDSKLLQFCTGDADQFVDRIWFRDPTGIVLQTMLMFDASHDGNDPLHGRSCVLSIRERSEPSGQLCVHRGIDANNGEPYLVYEFDFDKAPPSTNPRFVTIHLGECAVNALTHGKTDQTAIAARLMRRGVIQEQVATNSSSGRVASPTGA